MFINHATEEKILVYCCKLNEFVAYVLDLRNTSDDIILKIGIDGGSNSLKICLSIQDKSLQESCDFKTERHKDSGVKKIFILAIGYQVEESYENLKYMFGKLNLQNLLACFCGKFIIVGDMKIINMVLGKLVITLKH